MYIQSIAPDLMGNQATVNTANVSTPTLALDANKMAIKLKAIHCFRDANP